MKGIHPTIRVTSRISNINGPEERWQVSPLRGLSTAQQHHDQEQVSTTANRRT